MYDRSFFRSTLGQAALVSITAMVTFVALSSQIIVSAPMGSVAVTEQVELA
ncbi:hypothetical protein ACRAQ7_07995 [Erythrobacter sp. W53]|uniref:hypothetical protein n=1 Tax=Erythrobacteraceae TaxID=335929 RepID=UPI0036D31E9B